jgi:hypothetical protein
MLVALGALAAAVALVAGLARPAGRRAGLVAGGLPLSLLPPVATAGYGSWRLVRELSGLVQAPAEAGDLTAAFERAWLLQRVAWGAFAAACLVGLVIGLSSFLGSPGDDGDGPRCSARRAVVLVFLPVLALLVAGLAARPLARALRVSSAVVSSHPKDPALQKRAEEILAAEGFGAGSGSIGSLSRFVSGNLVRGVLGGVLGAFVLVGLALPGYVLAWRVRSGPALAAAASALWLVAAAGASLVALGVVDPLLRP